MKRIKSDDEKFDHELIMKIAQMYYIQDIKQTDIADTFNLTQSRVSMLLKEAKRRDFVKITIAPPAHKDFKQEILNLYPHLKEVTIVKCQDDANLKNELGLAAANYFETNVKNEDVIAISCGTTIGSMINHLSPNKYSILEVAPLLITGVGRMVGWTPVTLVSNLISKYDSSGVIGYGYQFPPLLDSQDENSKEYYLNNKFVKKVLDKAAEADFTFIGIGIVHQKHKVFEFSKFLEDHDLENIVYQSEAIGEICYQPFDKDGNVLVGDGKLRDLHKRFIYVPLQKLVEKTKSNYYRIVAVAGGKAKKEVIQTSLKMKCYNVLICDITVAESLCKS